MFEENKRLSIKTFSDVSLLYKKILFDINNAKEYIYLETYIFDADSVGRKFRNLLAEKAKQGVEVKVLVDSWGSSANDKFMSKIVSAGGEVRFFRKPKFKLSFFKHHHRRDHRKLLVIDDRISYIGSTNYTTECLKWRELTLRIEGGIATIFKKQFLMMFKLFKAYRHRVKKMSQIKKYEDYAVIPDVPSKRYHIAKRTYLQMFRNAKKEVLLETPYFSPDMVLRKAMYKAARRGVEVHLIFPKKSDVKIMNVFRNYYLGKLHRKGVKIHFFRAGVLHSKAILIDDSEFFVGSSNVDYRSFVHQYELGLRGKNERHALLIKKHFLKTLADSDAFVYHKWAERSIFRKWFENILALFRRYL